MNELLFECYSVPKLAYGVDGLLSLHQNHPDDVGLPDYALIVSVGHHTVHVMPIVNGKVDLEGVRKVNVGGHQLVNHTWKALQLKYPYNSGSISVSILVDHCYCRVSSLVSIVFVQIRSDTFLTSEKIW